MGEKWMLWTLAEAGTKTGSKLLQKVVGNVSSTFAHTFFATLIIGLIQVISGFLVTRRSGVPLFKDRVGILGSCLFGFFAVVSTVLGFAVFLLGGEVGINTFIITLSIVPGALIDRFGFGKKLSGREWLGIAVAIFAGYSMLGWPSPATALKLPLWVWLSLGITFSVAINQGITQKVKKVDPFVKNFWGGLTTIVLCLIGMVVLGSLNLFIDFSRSMQNLWAVSAAIGLIVVGMWCFNLLSYKGGASIALKKLVMNGAYLCSAMAGGVFFFGEKFSGAKIAGIGLFFVAFVLMDKGTWNFLSGFWTRRKEIAST